MYYTKLVDFVGHEWAFLIVLLGLPITFAYSLSLVGSAKRYAHKKAEERARKKHHKKQRGVSPTDRKPFDPTPFKHAGVTIGLFTELLFVSVYFPAIFFSYVQMVSSYQLHMILEIAVYAVTLPVMVFWGYQSLRKIRPAWKGVLTVFGRRVPNVQIAEGANLLPWLIWSAIPVNMKEMSLKIGKGEEEEGHEEEGLVLTSNRVRVLFDLSITYKVFDPYRFTWIGMDMVDTSVHDLALAQVRSKIADTPDDEVYKLSEELRQSILYALDEKSDVWGIFVTKVIIKYILPFSDTVANAYEKQAVEEDERDGETVERKFNLESLEMYQKAGLTPEGAAAMHAGERGKDVKVSVRRILVNDEGLNVPAAIAADRGGDDGSS